MSEEAELHKRLQKSEGSHSVMPEVKVARMKLPL